VSGCDGCGKHDDLKTIRAGYREFRLCPDCVNKMNTAKGLRLTQFNLVLAWRERDEK
jgi:hypothetical protein